MGCVWLYGAFLLPQTSQYAVIGPGLSLTVIGLALIVLGGILMLQISRGERFEPQDTEDAMSNAPADNMAFYLATAAAALPVLMMKPVGFPVTAAISFALVARAFGSRRIVLDVIIGFTLSIVAYLGFSRLGINLGGFFPPLGA